MSMILAVPSEAPGGLDAELAMHFGHCDAFSLFTLDNGRVVSSQVVPFGEHGDCLEPVNMLAEKGVTAIVAGGMGARPLAGFLASGIQPYFSGEIIKVSDIIAAFIDNRLVPFANDRVCAHHHDGEGCDH